MAENNQSVFRQKTLDRISSPEQLNDYLHVTNPGIWVILAAVILLLAGVFVWSMTGTLETKTDVRVIVEDHRAHIVSLGQQTLEAGMPLTVSGHDYKIAITDMDEYGRSVGTAEVALPDGTYEGTVVTESVHPISFLLESR